MKDPLEKFVNEQLKQGDESIMTQILPFDFTSPLHTSPSFSEFEFDLINNDDVSLLINISPPLTPD